MKKAEGVTVDMRDCIATEAKAQDTRLNRTYEDLMHKLTPDRRAQLLDAQRKWLAFRSAHCDFIGAFSDGTASALMADDCYLSSTASRATEVEDLAKMASVW